MTIPAKNTGTKKSNFIFRGGGLRVDELGRVWLCMVILQKVLLFLQIRLKHKQVTICVVLWI